TTTVVGSVAHPSASFLNLGPGAAYVSPIPAIVTLTSSANPVLIREAVTFTATVVGKGAIPTGTVTFKLPSVPLATVALVNGKASYTQTFTSADAWPITAVYSGDSNHLANVSSTLDEDVVINPLVTITGSPQQPLSKDPHGNLVANVT